MPDTEFPTLGPWSRLLLAAHAVLKPWDQAESFDGDSPAIEEVMNELAAASAAVDLTEATKADGAPDLLAAAKVVVYEFLSGMEYPEAQDLRDAIAASEGRES